MTFPKEKTFLMRGRWRPEETIGGLWIAQGLLRIFFFAVETRKTQESLTPGSRDHKKNSRL